MDYAQEQEMEIEALQAILMDDIQVLEQTEADSYPDAQRTFYQVKILPENDEDDSPAPSAQVALIFSHTTNYPDEPPFLDVRSIKGVRDSEVGELKQKLQSEAQDNIGMAMIYTLVSSAKEWLSTKFRQREGSSTPDEEETAALDEVVEPHGELVTVETFLAWRERFEAEMALERARLMPDSALNATKEKRLTGRAWFESAAMKGGKPVCETSDEEAEEELDFDADYDDGDLDEDDMLDHYLSQKSEKA